MKITKDKSISSTNKDKDSKKSKLTDSFNNLTDNNEEDNIIPINENIVEDLNKNKNFQSYQSNNHSNRYFEEVISISNHSEKEEQNEFNINNSARFERIEENEIDLEMFYERKQDLIEEAILKKSFTSRSSSNNFNQKITKNNNDNKVFIVKSNNTNKENNKNNFSNTNSFKPNKNPSLSRNDSENKISIIKNGNNILSYDEFKTSGSTQMTKNNSRNNYVNINKRSISEKPLNRSKSFVKENVKDFNDFKKENVNKNKNDRNNLKIKITHNSVQEVINKNNINTVNLNKNRNEEKSSKSNSNSRSKNKTNNVKIYDKTLFNKNNSKVITNLKTPQNFTPQINTFRINTNISNNINMSNKTIYNKNNNTEKLITISYKKEEAVVLAMSPNITNTENNIENKIENYNENNVENLTENNIQNESKILNDFIEEKSKEINIENPYNPLQSKHPTAPSSPIKSRKLTTQSELITKSNIDAKITEELKEIYVKRRANRSITIKTQTEEELELNKIEKFNEIYNRNLSWKKDIKNRSTQLKEELATLEMKDCSFTPRVKSKSNKKILSKSVNYSQYDDTDFYKKNLNWKKQIEKNKQNLHLVKERKEYEECSFNPMIKKNMNTSENVDDDKKKTNDYIYRKNVEWMKRVNQNRKIKDLEMQELFKQKAKFETIRERMARSRIKNSITIDDDDEDRLKKDLISNRSPTNLLSSIRSEKDNSTIFKNFGKDNIDKEIKELKTLITSLKNTLEENKFIYNKEDNNNSKDLSMQNDKRNYISINDSYNININIKSPSDSMVINSMKRSNSTDRFKFKQRSQNELKASNEDYVDKYKKLMEKYEKEKSKENETN